MLRTGTYIIILLAAAFGAGIASGLYTISGSIDPAELFAQRPPVLYQAV